MLHLSKAGVCFDNATSCDETWLYTAGFLMSAMAFCCSVFGISGVLAGKIVSFCFSIPWTHGSPPELKNLIFNKRDAETNPGLFQCPFAVW